MLDSLKKLLSKKKIQHFIYIHLLFVAGLIFLDITLTNLLWSLAGFILIVYPLNTVIVHTKFKHDYVEFRNKFTEAIGLLFICMYSHFKPADFKSYHIQHHKRWLTYQDPTAAEIQQGWLKYYVGLTEPCAIEKVVTRDTNGIKFLNQYFWISKFVIYAIIVLCLGVDTLFLSVIAQQFYYYAIGKVHDIAFHGQDLTAGPGRNLPWTFPIWFNNAWHAEHHADYSKQEPWHWHWINPQFWFHSLLFKN